MTTQVAINGFGRMGRLIVRALAHHPELRLVHVNEHKGDVHTAAHLLQFDTVHGKYDGVVETDNGSLRINDQKVSYSSSSTPIDLHWNDLGVDIVLECTGALKTVEKIEPHFANGAQKVVVAAPVKESEALNVVMGCNDHLYDPSLHRIVTAASCTTNSIAPVVKVLHENVGIERGVLTTIHDVTNTQVIVDAPHKDLRRARSALNSLIPTSTGSATAITMIYPELKGKLNGLAVRVPLLNASLTDAVFTMSRSVTSEEINGLFASAAEGQLKGILGYETRPLVSADYVNDPRSGIVDALSTMVIDHEMLKVLVWYDNEYGYVHRMAELAALVARSIT
jgi:glyceraldehyde 3-phosphate dehydrogenase